MNITIRNFTWDDLQRIVDVVNAADAFDQTQNGTSMEESREWYSSPGFDAEQNIFIAESDQQMVGFGYIYLAKDSSISYFRTWLQVLAHYRSSDVAEKILARQYAQAEKRLKECSSPTVDFMAQCESLETWRIPIFERFGLREKRRYWRMVCPLENAAREPQFPPNIRVRPYRKTTDDVAVLDALNVAFHDHWGSTPLPLDQWQHYASWEDFKHELCVIATDTTNDTIAGFCTIVINHKENARIGFRRGWIDDLGVRREYRNRGLGTALLLAGMQNLKRAGVVQAALGADSENLTGATRIYERVGFVVDHTRIAYSKRMRGT